MTAVAWHLLDSTFFAVFIGILCLCTRRRGPVTRYALWLIAAAKFVLPLRVFSWLGETLARLLPARPVSSSVAATVYGIYGWAGSAPVSQPASGSPHALVSGAFLAIWLLGSAAAFALWLRRLKTRPEPRERQVTLGAISLPRLKQRIGLRGEIGLRLSRELAEPALAGFRHPVVLIPAGLAGRLSAAELESVVLHELAHAKRRDNWTAAFAHAVRCIFWFYPLLWWIEKRLHGERELACDELVVRSGAAPEDYVTGILKVCRFRVNESAAGICGICGSNLKNRMEKVMSLTYDVPFRRAPKLFLTSLLIAIAAVPLITGFLTTPRAARAAEGRSASPAEPQKPIICTSAGVDYPEGTVIQVGDGAEQICVRGKQPVDAKDPRAGLQDVPMWVQISDSARQRAAAVVHLPQPPPVRCSPEPPNGSKLCSCAGSGEFSPGAVVLSANGASQLACDGGGWVPILNVSGEVEAANLIHRVPPEYPAVAKAAHVEGTVVFHAIVAKDGAIQSLQYVSGPQMLVSAARKAILQWRYRPTVLDGQPVEVDTSITVDFF